MLNFSCKQEAGGRHMGRASLLEICIVSCSVTVMCNDTNNGLIGPQSWLSFSQGKHLRYDELPDCFQTGLEIPELSAPSLLRHCPLYACTIQ